MLSLVTQDGLRKIEVKNYSILNDRLRAFIITDNGLILGEYKTLEKAREVFYEMIKMEERQMSFLSGTLKNAEPYIRKKFPFKNEDLKKGSVSNFLIYEMPLDEDTDDEEDDIEEL